MLAIDLGQLAARPPPLETSPCAFMCVGDEVSIANRENTKAFLFKEPKLLVQTMDGMADQIPSSAVSGNS